jgi:hypothetical protein
MCRVVLYSEYRLVHVKANETDLNFLKEYKKV